MQGDAEVIPGVQLVHVDRDGQEVTADVFGGSDPVVMAEVVFRVEDPVAHERLVHTFEKWEDQARPLTLVHGEQGVIALVDEDGATRSEFG